MYDLGDRLLMVASDRISTYDVVHPNADPGQGQGPHRAVGLLVRARPATSSRTTSSRPPTACRRRRAAARSSRASSRCCRSSASCAATSPARAGRTTRRTGTVSGIELPPGLQESERLPTPIFTPSTKAEEGHDETIDFDQRRRARRRPRPRRAACATSRSQLYSFAADHARERGVILADTKFEFGLDDERRARPRRRGAHARLLALLARRRLRRPGRSQPSFDKQYVRDWASRHRLGQVAARARDPRRRRRTARAQRYVEAYERITGESFDAWLQRIGCAARPRPRPAEGGDPRPAGPRGRAGAARARLRAAWPTSTSAGSSSSTSTTRRRSPRCARSSWPTR